MLRAERQLLGYGRNQWWTSHEGSFSAMSASAPSAAVMGQVYGPAGEVRTMGKLTRNATYRRGEIADDVAVA